LKLLISAMYLINFTLPTRRGQRSKKWLPALHSPALEISNSPQPSASALIPSSFLIPHSKKSKMTNDKLPRGSCKIRKSLLRRTLKTHISIWEGDDQSRYTTRILDIIFKKKNFLYLRRLYSIKYNIICRVDYILVTSLPNILVLNQSKRTSNLVLVLTCFTI